MSFLDQLKPSDPSRSVLNKLNRGSSTRNNRSQNDLNASLSTEFEGVGEGLQHKTSTEAVITPTEKRERGQGQSKRFESAKSFGKDFLDLLKPADKGGIPVLETELEQRIKRGVVEASPSFVGNLQTSASQFLEALNKEAQQGFSGELKERLERGTGRIGSVITGQDEEKVREQIFGNIPALIPQAADSLEERAEKNIQLGRNLAVARSLREQQAEREGTENVAGQFVEDVAGAGLSLAGTVSGGAVGGLVAGPPGAVAGSITAGGFLEGGAAINQAKQTLRQSDSKAFRDLADDDEFLNSVGLSVGILTGVPEGLAMTRIISRLPGSRAIKQEISKNLTRSMLGRAFTRSGKITQQSLIEGATEGSQEILANAVAKTYDENQNLFEGVAKSALIGAVLGGGVEVSTQVAGRVGQVAEETVQESQRLAAEVGGERGFARMPFQGQDTEAVEQQLEQSELAQIDRASNELEDVLSRDPEFFERTNVSREEFEQLQNELSISEEALRNNPARQLAPFARKTGEESGTLPEVTGEGQSRFAREGDQIADQLGFDGSEQAREAFQSYLQQREQFNQLSQEVKTISNDLRTQERVNREILQEVQKRTNELVSQVEQQRTTEGTQTRQVVREQTGQTTQQEATALKDRIRNISRGAREGERAGRQTVEQRINQINELVDNSELTAKDKAKLRVKPKKAAQIKNEETFQKEVRNIEQTISRLERSERFRTARNNIRNTLKKTKADKKTGKPKGKFTPELQDLFDTLRQDLKLNQEQAQEKLNKNLETYANQTPPFEVKIENRLLAIESGSDLVTDEEVQELSSDLNEVVVEGRNINEVQSFQEWQELENDVESVTEALGVETGREAFGSEKKGMIEKVKARLKIMGVSWLADWDSILFDWDWNRSVDDKVLQNTFDVTQNNSTYKDLQGRYTRKLSEAIARAYPERVSQQMRLLPQKMRNLVKNTEFVANLVMMDIVKEDVSLGQQTDRDGNTREFKMKRGELIKRYIELQDPTLTESFIHGNRWSQEMVDVVIQEVENTPGDLAIANEIMEIYQQQYDAINPTYRKLNGVNLPRNPFYSNIRRRGFEIDIEKQFGEFMEEQTHRNAVTSGSFNERVNSILPIETQDAFQALDKHISETNYYVAWGEQVRRLHKVFNDQRVKDGAIATFGQNSGEKLLRVTREKIQEFAVKGHRNATLAEEWVGKVRRSFVAGKIMAKPAIAIKQMVSRVNYLEVLSVKQLTEGEAEFWLNPIENTRKLNEESPFIRERAKFQERDINAIKKSDEFARFNKNRSFLGLLTMNVSIGDKNLTIAPATWAYRKKLIEQDGMTPEQARIEYERFGNLTQQSSDISTQSQLQTGGEYAKTFTTFMTQQAQNLRKVSNAVKTLFQEGGFRPRNLRKVARTILIYHMLQNMLFQFVSTGFIQLIGGEDEDFLKDMARAGVLGSFNGLFIVGDLFDATLRMALGMQIWEPDTPVQSIAKDLTNLGREINPMDLSDFEVMSAIDDFARVGGDFGLPTEQALNMTKATGDLMEGNFTRGVLGMLQWSQFSLQPIGEGGGGTRVTSPQVTAPRVTAPRVTAPKVTAPQVTQ